MTIMAKQTKLEALEFDPSNDDFISEEELCKQDTVHAYEVI